MAGGNKAFYIETFGCQMNERDSETIGGLLSKHGMEETKDLASADVIILNTCAVRESAENKVWSRLGRIHSLRKNTTPPVMVLSGCMAQLPETVDRIRRRLPYVQIITGPGHIHKIPELVQKALENIALLKPPRTSIPPQVAVSPSRVKGKSSEASQILPEGLPRASVPGVSAFVNIMYGCDNFCSYCIVPYVRGPQTSRSKEAIFQEIADLADRGYKEVTLLGQNVNAYELDFENANYTFPDLLKDLDSQRNLTRLRYFTSHPRDFTKAMVDAVKDSPSICEHFHLPLQSGSDRILKTMNRGYTRSQYLELVEYIKREVPHASLTTDIIVGFPGETEEDFEDTLDMVRQCRYDGAFTFIFSPRRGTAAARMEEQVDPKTKSQRLQKLVEVQGEITRQLNQKLMGSTLEILVEGYSDPNPQEATGVKGRTRTNKMVIAEGDAAPGQLINVAIHEAGTWYLRGKIVP